MELKLLKGKKFTYLIAALAAGIILVVLSGTFSQKEKNHISKVEEKAPAADAEYTERKLEEILSTVKGISDVTVFVTYENNGKKNTAVFTESSHNEDEIKKESTRKDSVVMYKDDGSEQPFVEEEILPEIRGIIISAKGASDDRIKLIIADAVSSAMDVPIYRVKVLSKD